MSSLSVSERNRRIGQDSVEVTLTLVELAGYGAEIQFALVGMRSRPRPLINLTANRYTRRLVREGRAECIGEQVNAQGRWTIYRARIGACDVEWQAPASERGASGLPATPEGLVP